MAFRDDTGIHPELSEMTVDAFSPHSFRDRIASSGAAIYGYSGWRDGAYPSSAAKRFRSVTTPGSRLTLGPWAHTGRLQIHPFGLGAATDFDHDVELLEFFDVHLKGAAPRGDGAPVHYFTLGEGRWKSASSWPPPDARPRTLFFASRRRLSFDAAVAVAGGDGADDYDVDPTVGTGPRSRWRSLLSLVAGDYPDRRERDTRCLVYDSPPLDRDTEATGHPTLTMFVAWRGTDDGRVFAYLEDVAPDGSVAYVTEGQLRAMHRRSGASLRRADAVRLAEGEVGEIELELLPVSYMWRKGHRVRIAIAGADADHFATPAGARTTMSVHRGGARPTRLVLPVRGGRE
jgi:putative CocE/NonD family hydrolase